MKKTLPPHPGKKHTARKTGRNLQDSLNCAPNAEYAPEYGAMDTNPKLREDNFQAYCQKCEDKHPVYHVCRGCL